MQTLSDAQGQLAQLITKGPLARYKEAVMGNLVRKAVGLRSVAPDDGKTVGNHRMGGMPDWPVDTPYPEIAGQPLSFLAQLALDQIDDERLPKHGMLYFFLGENESCSDLEIQVLHCNHPKTALQRLPPPTIPLRSPRDDYTHAPYTVELRPILSLAPYAHHTIDAVLGEDAEAYEAFTSLSMDWSDAHEGEHSLFGFAFSDWMDPRQDAVEHYPDTAADDWITLALFGHDNNTGFCFWDAGVLQFLIERKRLAQGDFSRAYGWLLSS